MAKVEVQRPAPVFSCFLYVFSFGFYTSNQFSEFSLFVYSWKSPIKTRTFLFRSFCRFVRFCCHRSLLINFSVKFWKFQSIYDLILSKLNVSLNSCVFLSQRILHMILIYSMEIIYILSSALQRSFILCSLWFSKMENDPR